MAVSSPNPTRAAGAAVATRCVLIGRGRVPRPSRAAVAAGAARTRPVPSPAIATGPAVSPPTSKGPRPTTTTIPPRSSPRGAVQVAAIPGNPPITALAPARLVAALSARTAGAASTRGHTRFARRRAITPIAAERAVPPRASGWRATRRTTPDPPPTAWPAISTVGAAAAIAAARAVTSRAAASARPARCAVPPGAARATRIAVAVLASVAVLPSPTVAGDRSPRPARGGGGACRRRRSGQQAQQVRVGPHHHSRWRPRAGSRRRRGRRPRLVVVAQARACAQGDGCRFFAATRRRRLAAGAIGRHPQRRRSGARDRQPPRVGRACTAGRGERAGKLGNAKRRAVCNIVKGDLPGYEGVEAVGGGGG